MNTSDPTERELVRRIRAGDQSAFRQLFGRYEAAARARVRAKLASRLTVDDELVVHAQTHRSRDRNTEDALDRNWAAMPSSWAKTTRASAAANRSASEPCPSRPLSRARSAGEALRARAMAAVPSSDWATSPASIRSPHSWAFRSGSRRGSWNWPSSGKPSARRQKRAMRND